MINLAEFLSKNIESINNNQDLSLTVLSSTLQPFPLFPKLDYNCRKFMVLVSNFNVYTVAVTFSIYTRIGECSGSLENYLYIEKIDTSGYCQVPRLASTLASSIVEYFSSRIINLNVHLYCATAEQYLFHSSCKNPLKIVKSDVGLIQWWSKCLSTSLQPQEKYLYLIGETFNSAKSITNALDSYTWGLGFPLNTNCSKLPLFEDDVVTKTKKYATDGMNVGEFMEMMECVENASGRRALIRLKFNNQESGGFEIENEIEMVAWIKWTQYWLNQTFDTLINAKKSTLKCQSYLATHHPKLTPTKVACNNDCKVGNLENNNNGRNNENGNQEEKVQKRMINDISSLVRKKTKI